MAVYPLDNMDTHTHRYYVIDVIDIDVTEVAGREEQVSDKRERQTHMRQERETHATRQTDRQADM